MHAPLTALLVRGGEYPRTLRRQYGPVCGTRRGGPLGQRLGETSGWRHRPGVMVVTSRIGCAWPCFPSPSACSPSICSPFGGRTSSNPEGCYRGRRGVKGESRHGVRVLLWTGHRKIRQCSKHQGFCALIRSPLCSCRARSPSRARRWGWTNRRHPPVGGSSAASRLTAASTRQPTPPSPRAPGPADVVPPPPAVGDGGDGGDNDDD